MTVRTIDAARRICDRGEWAVTNLQLQKILYMAHMVYLGRTGEPLVGSTFEAWDYGPVAPDLYRRVKMFGAGPIQDIFFGADDIDGTPEGDVVDEACENLLQRRPGELVEMTHWREGAWARNYVPGAMSIPIPDADIADEYRARIAR